MSKARQGSQAIQTILNHNYPDLIIKISDLYNLSGNFQTQDLGTWTSILVFLYTIQEREIFNIYKIDERGQIIYLGN